MPMPLPGGRVPRFCAPAGGLDHAVDALAEPDRGHGQVVRGLHERLGQVAPPHVGRVEPELLGGLVDLALHREARLGRPVAALGPAGRLVGEHARALELVDRDLVGHGLERPGIEGGGHPVGAVGPAVEPGAEVHPGDRAVLPEAGLDPHQHRMAPAVDVEDLLAGQRDLHRPAAELRELARRDLVREGVELAAEAAPHRRGHHPDVGLRHVEDLGEEPVHVVRRLRRRPERQLAVGAPLGHRRVLLHRQVGVALEEEHVLPDQVGRGEGRLHVAELERHRLVHVRPVAVLVDPHLRMRQRVLDGHERPQRLVLDLDQLGRALGGLLVHRGHRGHRVADHADLLHAERLLVLRDRQDAELHPRQVVAGDDRVDAGQGPGARGVDALDQGVRVRAPQQLAVGHARHQEVVGELGLADDLGPRVDLGQRLADDREAVLSHVRAPLIRRAASSTASRIFV